jgi:hypothetical protein
LSTSGDVLVTGELNGRFFFPDLFFLADFFVFVSVCAANIYFSLDTMLFELTQVSIHCLEIISTPLPLAFFNDSVLPVSNYG